MQLTIKYGVGGVEIQARMHQGDGRQLASGWNELQQQLSERGVNLGDLTSEDSRKTRVIPILASLTAKANLNPTQRNSKSAMKKPIGPPWAWPPPATRKPPAPPRLNPPIKWRKPTTAGKLG